MLNIYLSSENHLVDKLGERREHSGTFAILDNSEQVQEEYRH